MWQSLGRNLKGLLTAACLLTFILCAIEIGLRVDRYRSALSNQPSLAAADLPIEDQLVSPSMDTWVELLRNAKTTLKNPDTDQPVAFRTNSFGARGPEVTVPKPRGLLRVLCLGDETTLAPELAEAEAYPAVLQELLSNHTNHMRSKVEVINAGVPGSCPRIAALQLRHGLMSLQPDLIVLHFDMSDVAEDAAVRRFVSLDREGNPTLAIHPATRKACQLRRPRLADEFMVVQQAELQLARIWDRNVPVAGESVIDRNQRYRWTADHHPDLEAEINSSMAPIRTIRDLATALGARVLVSTTPKPWQVSPNASNTAEARAINGIPRDAFWESLEPFQRLVAACKKADVEYVITRKAFVDAPECERLFLKKSPALSTMGHDLYARILADTITGGGLKSPSAEQEIIPSGAEEPVRTRSRRD